LSTWDNRFIETQSTEFIQNANFISDDSAIPDLSPLYHFNVLKPLIIQYE